MRGNRYFLNERRTLLGQAGMDAKFVEPQTTLDGLFRPLTKPNSIPPCSTSNNTLRHHIGITGAHLDLIRPAQHGDDFRLRMVGFTGQTRTAGGRMPLTLRR